MQFSKEDANLIKKISNELRDANNQIHWLSGKIWDLLDLAEKNEIKLDPEHFVRFKTVYDNIKATIAAKVRDFPVIDP